ncbi:late expression factor 6 [Diatraea saccharalis granulovirus]|uniref:Late expression factor 6 n=1 Tax=Diatraea saccharalis granulovirus TaxID=1675862 RepID=A0A0R7EYZ1_9BBAC|nr:late expression factor 6 [Diatraea saccharalis granulovirus]AKN80800.1 late expression factor 6 [Diatraea saccharalis granulovirus]
MPKTLLYLNNTYPLWLTKDLMLYVGGKKIVECIDWRRSRQKCLYVKKKSVVDKIKKMKFYYPDGEMINLYEKEDIIDDDGDDDDDDPQIYWFED